MKKRTAAIVALEALIALALIAAILIIVRVISLRPISMRVHHGPAAQFLPDRIR
jgi:hypothetical protein